MGISSSDSPHCQKKPEFGSVIFVIFPHTFKISSLLIFAAARKKVIDGPEFGSNLVKIHRFS